MIAIVYTSVGAGHARAAEAIHAALLQRDPPIQAEVIDALAFAPGWFRLLYGGGYAWLAGHWPGLYGFLYRMTNRPPRWYHWPAERIRIWLETYATRPLARYLAARQPLHLVSAHVLFAPHVGVEFADMLDRTDHVVVVTDNEAHRCWRTPGARQYFVNSGDVVEDLIRLGVSRDRITVCGIPVHPVWHEHCDPQEVRRRWNLPADRPVLLLVGGAHFTVGPFEQLVQRLAADNPHVHLVAVAGRNPGVYARLRDLSKTVSSITAVGFTDRLHELMSAACLLVSKPGGLITSEALAKGLPMIAVNPIPGQELANARYLEEHGAGRFVRRTDDLPAVVRTILQDPATLHRMQQAARSLARPGAHIIAEFIEKWIAGSSDSSPSRPLCSAPATTAPVCLRTGP